MKLLVAVKRVVDYNVNVRVRADGSGVDLTGVKMSMNPFDEIAVEEALRLREKGVVSEVIAVSMGSAHSIETLRTALAMGADRGILVETTIDLQPMAVAKMLRAIAIREEPGMIIIGKQAIDDEMNATGQMLAALLGRPQGTFTSKLDVTSTAVLTAWLLANADLNPRETAAGAVPYMKLTGVVAGGWQMARAARIARDLLKRGEGSQGFATAKVATARFYADHILPAAQAYRHEVTAGGASTLAFGEALF